MKNPSLRWAMTAGLAEVGKLAFDLDRFTHVLPAHDLQEGRGWGTVVLGFEFQIGAVDFVSRYIGEACF